MPVAGHQRPLSMSRHSQPPPPQFRVAAASEVHAGCTGSSSIPRQSDHDQLKSPVTCGLDWGEAEGG